MPAASLHGQLAVQAVGRKTSTGRGNDHVEELAHMKPGSSGNGGEGRGGEEVLHAARVVSMSDSKKPPSIGGAKGVVPSTVKRTKVKSMQFRYFFHTPALAKCSSSAGY